MSSGPTATSPATREPLAWVAWIRLVAVLGVISIHNAGANATAARAGDTSLQARLGVLLDIPFIVAVPIFVMVSGALTLDPARFRGTGPYLRRRVMRTVPAIVFWHLAYIAFLQLWYYPKPLTSEVVLRQVLTGRLAPHLYFLWITLGLSLLAPILVRWLGQATRREQIWTGVLLAAIPALSTATRQWRGTQAVAVETPWTWWFCYLGLFVLGWALRHVVLHGIRLLAAVVGGLGLVALGCAQFARRGAWPRLDELMPVSYYGAGVIVAAVLLFLVARATIRPGGALGALARPAVLRLVDPVAKASLGIYACHVMVMWALMRSGILAQPVLAPGPLVARFMLVSAIAVAVTLVAGRVPGLRRVF